MTDEERKEFENKVLKFGLLQFRGYDPKNPQYLLNPLKENRIVFGSRMNFNDPFDCNLPIRTNNTLSDIQTIIMEVNFAKKNYDLEHISQHAQKLYLDKKSLKRQLENLIYKHRRFSCFTIGNNHRHLTNNLFWANYANKHKGICMKFKGTLKDTLKQEEYNLSFIPVEYCKTDEIPIFNYITNRLQGRPEYASQYFFGTKSSEWIDEEEIRLILYSKEEFKDEYLNIEFNPNDLVEVYLGCNLSENEKKEILLTLQYPKYRHVKKFEHKRASEYFRLNPIQL